MYVITNIPTVTRLPENLYKIHMKKLTVLLIFILSAVTGFSQTGEVRLKQLERSGTKWQIIAAKDSLADIDKPYFPAYMNPLDLLDSVGFSGGASITTYDLVDNEGWPAYRIIEGSDTFFLNLPFDKYCSDAYVITIGQIECYEWNPITEAFDISVGPNFDPNTNNELNKYSEQSTAPTTGFVGLPKVGDLWLDTDDLELYIYTNGGEWGTWNPLYQGISGFKSGDNVTIATEYSDASYTFSVKDGDSDPTNELFDSTTVYQTIIDTALQIRNDIITDHGALTGLSDNDHPQYNLKFWETPMEPSLGGSDIGDYWADGIMNFPAIFKVWNGFGWYDIWQEISANKVGENVTLTLSENDDTAVFSVADNDNDPTNELFDSTTVYQTIIDTAIQIRNDFPVIVADYDSIYLTGNTLYNQDGIGVDLSQFLDNTNYWTLNGSDIYRLSNVGIGTSLPTAKMHVMTNDDIRVLGTDNSGTEFFRISADHQNSLFIGRFAGQNNAYGGTTVGSENTFVGTNAGQANTTGYANTSFGFASLYSNTTGTTNTAIGYQSLFNNTSGVSNVALGVDAGYHNKGDRNTYIGFHSGKTVLSSDITGVDNVFIGFNTAQYHTTGDDNMFIGAQAGLTNSTGSRNVGIGKNALFANTTGYDNMGIGYEVLRFNNIGYGNTAIGRRNMYSNTSGYFNTSIGYQSLFSNVSGIGNTAIGYSSLGLSNASTSTAVGYLAGHDSGGGGVFLGYRAGDGETGANKLYIDNSNTTLPLIYGDFATNELTVNGKLGYTVQGGTSVAVVGRDASGYLTTTSVNVDDADASSTNEIQDLTYSGYVLTPTGGGGVNLPFYNDTGDDWYSDGEFGFGIETNPIYEIHMSGTSGDYAYAYWDDYTGFFGEDNSAGTTGQVWTRGGNGMRWEDAPGGNTDLSITDMGSEQFIINSSTGSDISITGGDAIDANNGNIRIDFGEADIVTELESDDYIALYDPTSGGNVQRMDKDVFIGLVADGNTPLATHDQTLTENRDIIHGNYDLNFDANTLFIDGSANRVGINNAAPSHELELTGTANLDDILVYNAGGNSYINNQASGNLYIRNGIQDNDISFSINSGGVFSNALTVSSDNGGSVGVGSIAVNPTALLDVGGTARVRDLTTVTPTYILGADNLGVLNRITIGSGIDFSSGTISADDNSASNEFQTISKVGSTVTLSDGGGSFIDEVGTDDWDNNGTAIYYNDGKVGINQINPVAQLQINNPDDTSVEPFRIYNDNGQLAYAVDLAASGAPLFYLNNGATRTHQFYTGGNSYVNIGNFGIGTNLPTHKLHVDGDIRATGGYYDSGNSIGSSGQILSSTGTGTDWVAAPTDTNTPLATNDQELNGNRDVNVLTHDLIFNSTGQPNLLIVDGDDDQVNVGGTPGWSNEGILNVAGELSVSQGINLGESGTSFIKLDDDDGNLGTSRTDQARIISDNNGYAVYEQEGVCSKIVTSDLNITSDRVVDFLATQANLGVVSSPTTGADYIEVHESAIYRVTFSASIKNDGGSDDLIGALLTTSPSATTGTFLGQINLSASGNGGDRQQMYVNYVSSLTAGNDYYIRISGIASQVDVEHAFFTIEKLY
jgi:hypothetical protein